MIAAIEFLNLLQGLQIRIAAQVISVPIGDGHLEFRLLEAEEFSRDRVSLAIEQGSTLGWERYIGPKGRVIGMHTFGASAPLKALQSKFGFDPASILTVAREMLSSS